VKDEGVLVKELRDCGVCAGSMEHIKGGGWWSAIECVEGGGVDGKVLGSARWRY